MRKSQTGQVAATRGRRMQKEGEKGKIYQAKKEERRRNNADMYLYFIKKASKLFVMTIQIEL